MMFLKINNAINYVLRFLNNIAQTKFDIFKLKFLKIYIKVNFSLVFSPMICLDWHLGKSLCHIYKNIYIKFNQNIKFICFFFLFFVFFF